MKKILKGIKNSLSQMFAGSQKGTAAGSTELSSLNKGPVNPGLEVKSENIGKKVFEKTGSIREGVGQSSTRKSQYSPDKTSQGQSKKLQQEHSVKKETDEPKTGLNDIREKEPLVPQEKPVKTNQGIKEGQKYRKPYKKPNKKRNGGFKNKDQEKNNR